MTENKEKLIKCLKCQLPETYETIVFNKNGTCNICDQSNKKLEIDWEKRKLNLDKLVNKHRGKYIYDCIIPFSGGKDSVFQAYYLIKEYKIKPLLIRFNHGFIRKTTQENVDKIIKKLGVDFIDFTPNWKIVKKLMLESFRRKTDFCWHCHTGIYSYPIRLALMYKVPLIFYGEPQAEFNTYYNYDTDIDAMDLENEERFNMIRTLGITAEDMYEMIDTPEDPVDKRDLIPYTFPNIKDLENLKYLPVNLGSFIPWDHHKNTEIIKKELGWKIDELEGVPSKINQHGEKIECFMQGTRDYIKFLKRGYSRVSQINALNVRNQRMTSEEAKEINKKYDGRKPPSLEIFLEYVGLSEKEFNEIVDRTIIPPHQPNYQSNEIADKTWDFDQWYREDNKTK